MFELLKEKWKTWRQKVRVRKVMSDPVQRLQLLEAGYKKFSVNLSETERRKMKKEMHAMRKVLKAEIRRAQNTK